MLMMFKPCNSEYLWKLLLATAACCVLLRNAPFLCNSSLETRLVKIRSNDKFQYWLWNLIILAINHVLWLPFLFSLSSQMVPLQKLWQHLPECFLSGLWCWVRNSSSWHGKHYLMLKEAWETAVASKASDKGHWQPADSALATAWTHEAHREKS